MKSSDGRSNFDFFNVQPTELIVDPIVDEITCTFCIGFFIPNGDTTIVSLNTNSIVFHDDSVSDEIKIQVVDTLHTTVVCVQKVIKSLNSLCHRVTRIDLLTNRNCEHINSSILSILSGVSDAHIGILLETIHRTGVHVMSSQLATEVDFSFPALGEK